MAARETAAHLVTEFAGRARAFVQVQQGCDHRCTFCIIPFGRGPNRSVPIGAVVAQIRALVAAGFQRGRADRRRYCLLWRRSARARRARPDGPPAAGAGAGAAAAAPVLDRPAAIDDDLWRLIAEEPRLMPHLHLSLQAGSDLILKRMRRRHSRAERAGGDQAGARPAAGHCHRRRPDRRVPDRNRRAVRGDAGLRARRRESPILHVFPYSERPGTPAARMPPVVKADRRERAALLRQAGEQSPSGSSPPSSVAPSRVLTEAEQSGHSEHFAPVRMTHQRRGPAAAARVTGIGNGALLAEAA